jgi:hypothetical protein
VFLTGLSVVLSTLGVWLHQTAFDTDEFVAVVSPVIESPETKAAVADYVTREAIEAIDVEARVDTALAIIEEELVAGLLDAAGLPDRISGVIDERAGERLEALGGVVTAAVNSAISRSVDAIVFSEEIEDLIVRAVTRAHTAAVALIRGDDDAIPNAIVEDGEVRLNLVPLIAGVLDGVIERVGTLIGIIDRIPTIDVSVEPGQGIAQLEDALGVTLPDDFGQVTVMSEESLTDIQAYARWFDRLVWLLIIVTIVLIGVVLWMSSSLVRGLAWASGAGIVGLLIGQQVIGRVTVNIEEAFGPGSPTVAEVVGSVADSLDRVVTIVLWIMIGIGLVSLLQTWLRDRSARADEGFLNRNIVLMRAGLVALALFALSQFGVGWWSVIIVGAALAGALWWLASEARTETGATTT